MQEKAGKEKLVQLCASADLKAGTFLAADPELDPPDLPDVATFLKEQGLSDVPI